VHPPILIEKTIPPSKALRAGCGAAFRPPAFRGRRSPAAVFVVVAAAFSSALSACGGPRPPISVMTRNLYLGADLSPLVAALTPQDLEALAGSVWRNVQDSRFPERAVSLANEIAISQPDVLCLQEVSLFRTQSPGNWQSGALPDASTVELDFLELLVAELQKRDLPYQTITVGTNADEELPALDAAGAHIDVRLTDRDVLLVRDGITAVEGPKGIFPTALTAPIGGAGGTTLTFHRGFVSADVTIDGKKVRVINSHLEVGALQGRAQEQQARELIERIGPYPGPAILAGDFNSPPDGTGTRSYALLTTESGLATKFRDTFQFRTGKLAAELGSMTDFTCCIDLTASGAPTPSSRIDVIFFRGAVYPLDMAVVPPERTAGGLWPSDHLGVFARLELR
jgi:endonuclease/exonuclease/phosphatase family metal-dependent hydrolase